MTTSGVYNIEKDLNELLLEAFQEIQVASDGEPLKGNMFNRGKARLNTMLKAWEGQGIHLWTYEEGTLFLVKGQSEYNFGTANLANDYQETTTDADEDAGQTEISVTSTESMANNDIIGIVLDDQTLHWSTVVSFVANDTVTIADPIPSAATTGAVVFYYTPDLFKPVSRVLEVRRKESTDYEIPINFSSRQEYMDLPNKSQEGTVIQTYYARKEPYGIMYVWNPPSSAKPVLRFTYERKIQIMVNPTDTFDVPEYWYDAVKYNLAARLAPGYLGAGPLLNEIKMLAQNTLDDALGFDTAVYPLHVRFSQRC